jgi:hypothetical protein
MRDPNVRFSLSTWLGELVFRGFFEKISSASRRTSRHDRRVDLPLLTWQRRRRRRRLSSTIFRAEFAQRIEQATTFLSLNLIILRFPLLEIETILQ